jgi:death on curing protein
MKKGIQYLTTAQILAIHDLMVKRFGGSPGIRDLGLIESAVARPQASFDGNDLYVSLFDKAAALLQSLLKNHPFVDGNKRTALTSAGIFMEINGFKLKNSHAEEVEFAIAVDNQHLSIGEISSWLKKNSARLVQ